VGPIASASPVTIVTIPSGRPASAMIRARRRAASGVRLDGFKTIVLLVAIEGATLCATWFKGWLKGVIAATSRSGSRRV